MAIYLTDSGATIVTWAQNWLGIDRYDFGSKNTQVDRTGNSGMNSSLMPPLCLLSSQIMCFSQSEIIFLSTDYTLKTRLQPITHMVKYETQSLSPGKTLSVLLDLMLYASMNAGISSTHGTYVQKSAEACVLCLSNGASKTGQMPDEMGQIL